MSDFLRLIKILHIFLKARLDVLVVDRFRGKWISFLLYVSPWKLYSPSKPNGERIRRALEEAGTIFY